MRNKYPERFEKITMDEQVLRKPSYQVDMQVPDQVAQARRYIKELDDILVVRNGLGQQDEIIGYGLAAVQLRSLAGLQAPRISVVRIPQLNKDHKPLDLDLINPQIIDMGKEFKYDGEGCLSFPDLYLSTHRFKSVKVGFIDGRTWVPREMVLYGFEAVVIQHEVDHHDGVLFMDHHKFPKKAAKEPKPNEPCPCGSEKKYKKCCALK